MLAMKSLAVYERRQVGQIIILLKQKLREYFQTRMTFKQMFSERSNKAGKGLLAADDISKLIIAKAASHTILVNHLFLPAVSVYQLLCIKMHLILRRSSL